MLPSSADKRLEAPEASQHIALPIEALHGRCQRHTRLQPHLHVSLNAVVEEQELSIEVVKTLEHYAIGGTDDLDAVAIE
jgi:hypothetical protein